MKVIYLTSGEVGMIIWLEGPDGAGKTTTARKLYDVLSKGYKRVCHAYHVDCVTYKASEVVQSNFTGGNLVYDAAHRGVLIADRCAQISHAVYTHALPERDWGDFGPPPAPPIPQLHIKQLLWVSHGTHEYPKDYTYAEIFAVKRVYRSLAQAECPSELMRYLPTVNVALETFTSCGVHGIPCKAYVGYSEARRATLSEPELLAEVARYATAPYPYRVMGASESLL